MFYSKKERKNSEYWRADEIILELDLVQKDTPSPFCLNHVITSKDMTDEIMDGEEENDVGSLYFYVKQLNNWTSRREHPPSPYLFKLH